VKKGLLVFVHDGSLYEFNWLETANVVHIWSCLCGLYELVCRASLRLYCNWSSSRGDSVDERVNHCSYNCEPLSIKFLNPLLYCWLYLKWDLVDVFIFSFLCMVICSVIRYMNYISWGCVRLFKIEKEDWKEVLVKVTFFVCLFIYLNYAWYRVWCFVDWWQGVGTGIVILLISGGKSSRLLVFSEDLFFIYLLPPIIFNAGYVYAPLNLNSVAFQDHCSLCLVLANQD